MRRSSRRLEFAFLQDQPTHLFHAIGVIKLKQRGNMCESYQMSTCLGLWIPYDKLSNHPPPHLTHSPILAAFLKGAMIQVVNFSFLYHNHILSH